MRAMRTHGWLVAVLAGVILAGATPALAAYGEPTLAGITPGLFTANISIDGDISDWGVFIDPTRINRPNSWWVDQAGSNLKSGISYWVEDFVAPGGVPDENGIVRPAGYVGPGRGGQNFDIEAGYAAYDENWIYIAIVSGTDRNYGEWDPDTGKYSSVGDVFLDLGAPGGYDGWDFAMETLTEGGRTTGTMYEGQQVGWTEETRDYVTSSPWAIDDNDTGVWVERSDIATNFISKQGRPLLESYPNPAPPPFIVSWDDPADHNIMEMRINRHDLGVGTDALLFGPGGGVTGFATIHYSMQGGNDQITLQLHKVPEPVSMAILGTGLCGLVIRRRRKRSA